MLYQMVSSVFQRLLAAMAAVVALSGVAWPQFAPPKQRVVIVQDESAAAASPASDHAAYRISIALDDAPRDAGSDMAPMLSLFPERLTPRVVQPELRLASALIVASVERPLHLLVLAVFFDIKDAATAPDRENVGVRLETRLLSYKRSLLAETAIEPKAAGILVARGCRDECLSSSLSEALRDPLRRIAEAARTAAASR